MKNRKGHLAQLNYPLILSDKFIQYTVIFNQKVLWTMVNISLKFLSPMKLVLINSITNSFHKVCQLSSKMDAKTGSFIRIFRNNQMHITFTNTCVLFSPLICLMVVINQTSRCQLNTQGYTLPSLFLQLELAKAKCYTNSTAILSKTN